MRHFLAAALLIAFPCMLPAQSRYKVQLGATGVFPVTGFLADEYSPGPGLRAGGEVRLHRFVAVDAGWTGAWMPGTECSRFGCEHPRYENRLIDYGLRGVIPMSHRGAELSLGVGGGYIWFDRSSFAQYYNSALLQLSVELSVPIGASERFRLESSTRYWRDLGRPIQQWVAIGLGVSYNFGRLR